VWSSDSVQTFCVLYTGLQKTTEGESIPQYKKELFYEHRPAEAHFPNYGLLKIKENAQSVHFKLITQKVARLYPDYLTGRKIPGVIRII
jgi:hypothetical protein